MSPRPRKAARSPFEKRLRKLMVEADISTYAELAEFSGLSEATIQRLCTSVHRPNEKTLVALANNLGCTTWDLLQYGLFDNLYVSQCPHCGHVLDTIFTHYNDSKTPCCNKIGTPMSLWPGYATIKLSQHAMQEPTGSLVQPILWCAMIESFFTELFWEFLSLTNTPLTEAEAILEPLKASGFKAKIDLYKNLFGNSIREVLQSVGLQRFHTTIQELFELRNQTAHGSNVHSTEQHRIVCQKVEEDIVFALKSLQNHAALRVREKLGYTV